MKPEKYNQQQEQQEIPPTSKNIAPGEIIIGAFNGIDEQGKPLVSFQQSPGNRPIVALSTVPLSQQQTGRQVALLFAQGDLEKPVIMGLIHSTLDSLIENFEMLAEAETTEDRQTNKKNTHQIDDLTLDGKRVVLEGKEEVVLKCGDASITLTKAGKILIRGKYLQSRSAGVNRILGGSVQVN